MAMEWKIIEAATAEEYKTAIGLFEEYISSLDFDLGFQNLDHELSTLPSMYGPPTGRLFLVRAGDTYVGCAGLRRIENDSTCELKRMYIQPPYRQLGIGKAIMERAIASARTMGYATMKLDTIGYKMPLAVKLYESYGFRQTVPYNYNPYEGVLYFEKDLR